MEKDNKTLLPVQVTPEQKEIIKKRAKKLGMTMGGFIRYMCIYAELEAKSDKE